MSENKVKIILVEPAGPLNVGSVARIMKNMCLQELILVNPHCDHLGDEARQMAVHAQEVLDNAQIVTSLPEALRGIQRAIATTSRNCSLPINSETPENALPWLLEKNVISALIFGPEDRGLNNLELNYANRFVGIPSNPEYPSLNLAQAVAICAYELYKGNQVTKVEEKLGQNNLASLDNLERYYQHLENLLLKIGYLYPHTTNARMEKFRRLFNRANLTEEEVGMLRGILSQMEWSLKQK
jgi:tRNA/rRNA methyltransferase